MAIWPIADRARDLDKEYQGYQREKAIMDDDRKQTDPKPAPRLKKKRS